jgi:hypothetical protein
MPKVLSKQNLYYCAYLFVITCLLAIVINTYFTIWIHKQLATAASASARWPVGSYVYDPQIGFDFAPDVSSRIGDQSFYVKSHHWGYRIGEHEDAEAWQSGGVLSLGCSFTYGDEVEAEETFTQFIADGLDIPAYNFGVCSFSYTHALLKARKLKRLGILDKLHPRYVVLGCWAGLPQRSRSPFLPGPSGKIQLMGAYITRSHNSLTIHPPSKIQYVFDTVALYRKEGLELNPEKFFTIFMETPGYAYLYLKNIRFLQDWETVNLRDSVSDYEIYDFYFTGIERVFADYQSRIIVLFMPVSPYNYPDAAIQQAVDHHPGILFVDGSKAITQYSVPENAYRGRHPRPSAHMAYAQETLHTLRTAGLTTGTDN